MLTFAASSLPILAVSIIALVELDQLRMLGEGEKSKCKNIETASLMFRLELLASCGAIVWLVGMIVDPLINCFGDIEFRSFILCRRRQSIKSIVDGDRRSSSTSTRVSHVMRNESR